MALAGNSVSRFVFCGRAKSKTWRPYGYTGEWYQGYINLLHLRARWYSMETGTFLSVDPVESEPPYQYVGGNPVNWIDPNGLTPKSNPSIQHKDDTWGVPSGYLEGFVLSGAALNCISYIYGEEIVYDFNTGERSLLKDNSNLFDKKHYSFRLEKHDDLFKQPRRCVLDRRE